MYKRQAFATIVAGIVIKNGMEGLATATVLAGLILVIMGFLRLGSLIRFIPYTITTGFTTGIAVTIFIGQIKDFLGLTFMEAPVETMGKLGQVISCINTLNLQALAAVSYTHLDVYKRQVFVSDDEKAVVGTINLDFRSLYLHFECAAYIYRNSVVYDVEHDFEETLKKCSLITMEDCKNYSWMGKKLGRLMRLIAPCLLYTSRCV